MKKLLVILLMSTMLIGCSNKNLSEQPSEQTIFSGEKLETSISDTVGFRCWRRHMSDTEGGSSSTTYNVVIFGDNMTLYEVSGGTTAGNGYTILYDISLANYFKNRLVELVNTEDWETLYSKLNDITSIKSIEESVVSEGMTDDSSRNEDGSYKWESEFNKKLGISE